MLWRGPPQRRGSGSLQAASDLQDKSASAFRCRFGHSCTSRVVSNLSAWLGSLSNCSLRNMVPTFLELYQPCTSQSLSTQLRRTTTC